MPDGPQLQDWMVKKMKIKPYIAGILFVVLFIGLIQLAQVVGFWSSGERGEGRGRPPGGFQNGQEFQMPPGEEGEENEEGEGNQYRYRIRNEEGETEEGEGLEGQP